jgi:hypothetical protein
MIKTGDILFVRGESIFSPIIRYFDKGNFSHCAIAISDTHILEAQYFRKVQIVPFYYGDNQIEIIDLGMNEEQKRKLISIGLQLTGTWYDYPQLAWYVLKKWFKLEGTNKFNNPNNMICSELINHILLTTGYITSAEKVEDLTPNQLYNFLKNLCNVRGICKEENLETL